MSSNPQNRLRWIIVTCCVAAAALIFASGLVRQTQQRPQPATPPPTLRAQPTILFRQIETTTVDSPDGRISLPTACYAYPSGTEVCRSRFPDGTILSAASIGPWSPDSRYSVVRDNQFQDSPCNRYSVWDMVAGKLLTTLGAPVWYQWAPTGHLIAYLAYSGSSTITMFDAGLDQVTATTDCLDWIGTYSRINNCGLLNGSETPPMATVRPIR